MDIRSAIFAPGNFGETPGALSIVANPGSAKWMRVYAVLNIDVPAITDTRYIRTDTTEGPVVVTLATLPTVSVILMNDADVSDVQGASYWILLGKIRVASGFTASTVLTVDDIWESATCVPIHSALGVGSIRPAQCCYDSSLPALSTRTPWALSGPRPQTHLPSTMTGGATLYVPMSLVTPTLVNGVIIDLRNVADGDIIDATIDWRNRFFEWSAQAYAGPFVTTSNTMGPGDVGIPSALTRTASGMGQSFFAGSAGPTPDSRLVARVTSTDLPVMAAGSMVNMQVDSNGQLIVRFGGTPNCNMFFAIHASGQFSNAQ